MNPEKLGDIIILRSLKKEIGLPELQEYLNDKESYVWSSAIIALGNIGGRPAYDIWLKLLENENKKIVEKAIFAAGDLKDSRCIFPLANIYLHNNDSQLRFAVINTLEAMHDPRGIELLPVLLEQEKDEKLKDAIENCMKSQDYSNPFLYTFNGPEEKRLLAMENDFRILVRKETDLVKLKDIPYDQLRWELPHTQIGPQTYIIDANQRLYIGGHVEEHVKVAKGADVLAAGELWIDIDYDADTTEWSICDINNRSYGYYPAANSYSVVKPVLEKTGIKHPEKFTKIYPTDGYFSEDILSTMPMHTTQRNKKRKNQKS